MTEFERVDFSALDPARDPERWAGVMDATRLRVEMAMAGRPTASGAIDILGA